MGASSFSETLAITYHFAQCLIAKEYSIILITVKNLKLHITFILLVVTEFVTQIT